MENKTGKSNPSAGGAKKNKSSIVWLVLGAFVFFALIFSSWFCFEKIKQGSEAIALAKAGIALSEIQAREIDEFKLKYDNYLPNFQKIDRAIVNPRNPLSFIEFLEDSASERKLDLAISPISPSKDPSLETLSVQLSVKGEFGDIIAFLRKIEKNSYLILMRGIAVENTESKSEVKAMVSIEVLAK